ncbi:MAG TPA: AbrB/MazE/SpoVT family DNA-binding domain-containing protein [Candidatus Binataceae bacterium]|nr:AbrB/MazE/SpoVT family DNA-binding domain-containing protein [Candidatus Binataceae bacterium]
MRLKIDKLGRILVPKPLRDRLGLNPGAQLEVVEQTGGVLLRIARQRPSMSKVGGLWVHNGEPERAIDWDRIVDDVRDERTDSTAKN